MSAPAFTNPSALTTSTTSRRGRPTRPKNLIITPSGKPQAQWGPYNTRAPFTAPADLQRRWLAAAARHTIYRQAGLQGVDYMRALFAKLKALREMTGLQSVTLAGLDENKETRARIKRECSRPQAEKDMLLVWLGVVIGLQKEVVRLGESVLAMAGKEKAAWKEWVAVDGEVEVWLAENPVPGGMALAWGSEGKEERNDEEIGGRWWDEGREEFFWMGHW